MEKIREKKLRLKTVSPDEYIKFLIKILKESEKESLVSKLRKLFRKG